MSTTISGTSGVTFPDSTSMQTGQQACKAWVNFNGAGTVAIRAGYNVSAITDNGTGNYTVNFTTALPDANYVCNISTISISTADARFSAGIIGTPAGGATTKTTSQIRIFTSYNYSSSGFADSAEVDVAIFGN